jgi:hypothetical protein
MRLERVRRDAGIVAPHFVQQNVAGHHPLASAVEIFEDRGLLLGEPDLAAVAVDQKFRRRLESVGAYGKNCVLALLVLPELGADAREQHAELERLGHIVVGTRLQPEDGIGIRDLRRQHDDRALEAATTQQLARLAAVEIRKANVEKHEIDMAVAGQLQPLRRSGRERGFELLVQRELLAQGLAKLVVIVDDEDPARVAHRRPLDYSATGEL